MYHAGDSLDSYAQEGSITRITVDHVTDGYVSLTSESWPGQSPIDVVREAFEKNLDNGVYKFIPETIEGNVPASTRMSADEIVKIPLTMEAALEYESLKQQYPDALIGFEQHGNYEFYGDDAEKAARIIKARILEKEFPGGRTAVTGFPAKHWAAFFRQLSLEGSDNPYPENDYSKTSEVKKSSVKSWIILNWKKVVAGIGTLIVAPLLVSLILWIINTKADIKYINRVIDDTKSQIESIEANINNNKSGDLYAVFATKELLDLKLELIEKDFKSLIPDTANIINRLSEIEEEIVSLQQLMEKNVETE